MLCCVITLFVWTVHLLFAKHTYVNQLLNHQISREKNKIFSNHVFFVLGISSGESFTLLFDKGKKLPQER